MSLHNVSAHFSNYNEELHPKIEQNKNLKCYTCNLIVSNANRAWCSSMVLSVASDNNYIVQSVSLLLEHDENEHPVLQKRVKAHVNMNCGNFCEFF
jgi:hypothetical protein